MEDMDDLPVEKLYELFSQSNKREDIVRSFQVLKSRLNLNSLHGLDLYKALKDKLGTQKTWKARDVFQLLEKRANQKEYLQQTAAKGVRVFIVGAGPIGLRQAIECILLGAEVIVVEKRSSFSRNNVLHLWPCTIEDLGQLGAKKFYGKFCAGAIDHISIRCLQCILLKVCLLLGVTIHSGVKFQEILEPDGTRGWHAKVSPEDHEAADFDFDVLVGADGRRSTIPGFDRKELRGKLALTITANFENCFTKEEAAVDEISGVAFLFNQKFFKDLKEKMDIDLENINYYKDDTHFFIMTATKDSLLKRSVLKKDYRDTRELLTPSNIEMDELYEYVTEAAEWSTDLQLHNFSVNHYGRPDVALFDFTSIYQAEYAARAINRKGKDLLLCVVGDALLEPFWPTGTGCSWGFLSAMDTAWLIRGLGQKRKMLDLLRERESIFQLLPQTFPEKLHTNIEAYTIDPQTRYQNLDVHRVKTQTMEKLYDIKTGCDEELHKDELSLKDPTMLQNWLQEQVKGHGIKVTDLSTSWSDGMALCALIYHFYPELIPNFDELSPSNAVENNQLAFSIAEEQFGITSLLKPTEMENPDKLGLFTYLSLFYEFLFNKEPEKPAPTKAPMSRSKTPSHSKSQFYPVPSSSSDICYFCNKKVYLMERMSANGLFFHRSCFRCSHCNCQLKIGGYSLSKGVGGEKGKFFCIAHYRQLFLSNPEAINYSRAGVPKRDSQQEEMEVEETKQLVKPSPSRPPIGGGIVKRLSQGFEQLEAAAKWEQSTLTGQDHVSSGAVPAKPPRSRSQLEPFEGTGQLAVIEEKKEEEGGRVSPSSPRRPRSPSQWRGPIVKRLPEDVKYLPRSSAKLKQSPKIRRGQKSVARSLIGTYDTSDVAIQERRKQQQRFLDAQLIQREMGQLERQYEELEEVGRHIEQCLRDAEGTSQEDQLMKSWVGLVNERNALMRKTSELSLRMKELELEDRQYEIDKELKEFFAIPEEEQTAEQVARFEELCEMKIKIVEERNELVMQTEEERIRELEEDEALSLRVDERFGSSYDSTSEVEFEEYDVSKLSKELNQLCAIPEAERTTAQRAQFQDLCEKRLSSEAANVVLSRGDSSPSSHRASEPEAQTEAILNKKEKRRSRMKSWFFGN